MQKILIVEDDKKIRKELETFLNKNGFIAKGLEKFDNTIQDILDENADLVLLDINLPYADGEFVCKEIRKTSDVPIIMVTSRDNEIDELLPSVIVTAVIIGAIYGEYFLATYFGSKNIIKEED